MPEQTLSDELVAHLFLAESNVKPLPYEEASNIFNTYLTMQRLRGKDDAEIAQKLVDNTYYHQLPEDIHEPIAVFVSKHGLDMDLPVNVNGPLMNLSFSREFMDELFKNGGARFVAVFIEKFKDNGVEPNIEDLSAALGTKDSEIFSDILSTVYAEAQSLEGFRLSEDHFKRCLELAPDLAYEYSGLFDPEQFDEVAFTVISASRTAVVDDMFREFINGNIFQNVQMTQELANYLASSGVPEIVKYAQPLGINCDNEFANACVNGGICDQVLKHISLFNGLSIEFVLDLIGNAKYASSFPDVEDLKQIEGIEFNGELADLLLSTEAGTKWFLDDNVDEFHGLTVKHVHTIIESGRSYQLESIFENADRIAGLTLDNEFAEYLGSTHFGLVNLNQNLRFFFGLSSGLLKALMEFTPQSSVETQRIGTLAIKELWQRERERYMLDHLFRFPGLSQELIDQLFQYEQGVQAFPGGGSVERGWSRQQNEWFGRNRTTEDMFEEEWSDERLGEIIGLRIRHGLATTLHDASYWLDNFKVEDFVADIDRIIECRLNPDFNSAEIPRMQLKDFKLEQMLLHSIVFLPAEIRSRLQLSSKANTEIVLFSARDRQLAYRALVDDYNGAPLYKHADLTPDMLLDVMKSRFNSGQYKSSDTSGTYTTDEILDGVEEVLLGLDTGPMYDSIADILYPADLNTKSTRMIGSGLRDLKRMGFNRKAYIDATQAWLKAHAATQETQLVQAWSGRAVALANGVETDENGNKFAEVEDNIKSIIGWQSEKAFKIFLENSLKYYTAAPDRTPDQKEAVRKAFERQLAEDKAEFRAELLRVLSLEHTARAMSLHESWLKALGWRKQLIPAQTTEVVIGDINYSLEILGKDDPRGFTIGEDTACCMTIDGKTADCIEAGYKYRNAGFIAMYNPQGNLVAQSFWYVNNEHPDTLVLDNIEANKGRDLRKVLKVYVSGLKKILSDYNDHAKKPITKVHLGEGYTDTDFTSLKPVAPVPTITETLSTDALRQRLLLELV